MGYMGATSPPPPISLCHSPSVVLVPGYIQDLEARLGLFSSRWYGVCQVFSSHVVSIVGQLLAGIHLVFVILGQPSEASLFSLAAIVWQWHTFSNSWILILFGQNIYWILLRPLFWNTSKFCISLWMIPIQENWFNVTVVGLYFCGLAIYLWPRLGSILQRPRGQSGFDIFLGAVVCTYYTSEICKNMIWLYEVVVYSDGSR